MKIHIFEGTQYVGAERRPMATTACGRVAEVGALEVIGVAELARRAAEVTCKQCRRARSASGSTTANDLEARR